MDKEVEILEIWAPVEKSGEMFDNETDTRLKLVAIIANGIPVKLEEGYVFEKSYMTRGLYNHILKNNLQK